MKKLFESVGIFTIICLSFLYTEKTVSVVKQYDDIMIEIKEKNESYKTNYINATIKENTIIPGVSGKKINENKSYNKMKRYGKFNSSLIVYEKIIPKISITNNKNKYIISGNPKKNEISLIFLIENENELNKILRILKEKKVKGNFFLSMDLISRENINDIIKEGHNVSCKMDYAISDYSFVDSKIKQLTKKSISYCYNEKNNKESLKICSSYNNYTIRPNLIIKDKPLKEIKYNITPGSLISLKSSDKIVNELKLIINYINSKGYKITTLNKHLSE